MSERTRVRWRFDPLPAVVGVASAVVFVLHGFNGVLSRDLAIYAYAGQQFTDGVPPYEGILNRAGPLAHMVPAVGVVAARVAGVDELLGMRVVFLAISALCVSAAYLLGRDMLRSRVAGLVAAATLTCFGGFVVYASGGPREKTVMVLFQLLSMWAASRRRWFWSGLFLGLATLVLQIVFLPGLALLVVLAFGSGWRGALKALLRVAAGGLLTVLVTVVYFAAVGAFGDFVDGFLLANARYSKGRSVFSDPTFAWRSFHSGFGFSAYVVLAGLVVLLVLAVPALVRVVRQRDEVALSVVAVAVSAVVAALWTARDFDSWPDMYLLLPMSAFGVAALAAAVERAVRGPAGRVAGLVWVAAALVLATTFAVTQRDDTLVQQRRSVDKVFSQLPADATAASVNAPQALVLTGRTNPTRYQTFSSGLNTYVQDDYPGGLEGYARALVARRPTVVTVYGSGGPPQWLVPALEQDYRRAGRAPGWAWYVLRSEGHIRVPRAR
ncbi:MAG: hypothetical protein HOQ22_02585 [Nocardioidaceae bacterium]|nr:hypothetical protein [Nocardioidaceae bacterium]NUS49912.1 hypothetical protein [Nocardioidaceae bacterium]